MTLAVQVCTLMRRKGTPVGVMMLDLDGFKKLNDTLGHAAGDRALRLTAATVRDLLRESDLVGRYGGDEFVILLPETSNAETVSEKLMDDLNGMLSESFGISATAGVSSGPMYCDALVDCLEGLLREADLKLRTNKRGKR